MSVDYLLHESSVGFAIFHVVHQPDTVGNRLKEVQASVQVNAVDSRNLLFATLMTFRTSRNSEKWSNLSALRHSSQHSCILVQRQRLIDNSEEQHRRLRMPMMSLKVLPQNTLPRYLRSICPKRAKTVKSPLEYRTKVWLGASKRHSPASNVKQVTRAR